MTAPNVMSQKWLSDIELLDYQIEQSDSLNPANVQKFFTSIASPQAKTTLTDGILSHISQEIQETIPWFLSQMPPLYLWSTSKQALMEDVLEIISGKVLSDKQFAENMNVLIHVYSPNIVGAFGVWFCVTEKLAPEADTKKPLDERGTIVVMPPAPTE